MNLKDLNPIQLFRLKQLPPLKLEETGKSSFNLNYFWTFQRYVICHLDLSSTLFITPCHSLTTNHWCYSFSDLKVLYHFLWFVRYHNWSRHRHQSLDSSDYRAGHSRWPLGWSFCSHSGRTRELEARHFLAAKQVTFSSLWDRWCQQRYQADPAAMRMSPLEVQQ